MTNHKTIALLFFPLFFYACLASAEITNAGTSQNIAVGESQSKTNGGKTPDYSYDSLGNLLQVTLPDNTVIEYLIDGQNRRIGKKVNGIQVQEFMYQDGLKLIAEMDTKSHAVTRFVYADKANVPDQLIKQDPAAQTQTTYHIVYNHLGSPTQIVNTKDGTIAQRIDYDAKGNVIKDTNPGFQPFGYAGGLYDPDTRLVRLDAGDYDTKSGRWIAKDPIRSAKGNNNL